MNCPKCGKYLGEGMLPARCPHCGANLANPTDSIRGSKASASRKNVEGLTGIGKGNTSNRRRHYLQVFLAVILVGGFGVLMWYASRGFGMEGELSVPDVVGWRTERATEELVSLGYGVVVEVTYDETQSDGVVLAQEPVGGVAARSGTQVRITVATSRVMPKVVGLSRDEAEEALKNLGISYTVTEELSNEGAGTVLSASVNAGVALGASDTVELVVALAPTVPSLVGKTQQEAVSLIEAQQLVAKVVLVAGDERDLGKVVSQDPDEGVTLPLGSKVEIRVAETSETQLKEAAQTVLEVIYDTDPKGDSIGQALLPLLSKENPWSGKDAHDVWWNVVKQGGRFSDQPEELQSLKRHLVSSQLEVNSATHTVVATITVKWDWTDLPGATVESSEDTRTVTMTFDEDGGLLSLSDTQTDVPFFRTGS